MVVILFALLCIVALGCIEYGALMKKKESKPSVPTGGIEEPLLIKKYSDCNIDGMPIDEKFECSLTIDGAFCASGNFVDLYNTALSKIEGSIYVHEAAVTVKSDGIQKAVFKFIKFGDSINVFMM